MQGYARMRWMFIYISSMFTPYRFHARWNARRSARNIQNADCWNWRSKAGFPDEPMWFTAETNSRDFLAHSRQSLSL